MNTFMHKIHQSVNNQRQLYETALIEYMKDQIQNQIYLRELLRISYDFAEEAIRMIKLLVSICDLKPIILWSTIKSHFEVAEALRNIPLVKSEKKGNTEEYIKLINGARNHAFHNFLLFDRSIEADLHGMQINAKSLTLLPLYGPNKRAIHALDYEDREIVEILGEFTRADETLVSIEFWQRNAELIQKFEFLLQKTEDVMWLINSARC